jgi:hypothetical protein
MPAVKWRPLDDTTMTRASPASSMLRTISGSSSQNSRFIEFIASGRDSRTWAILSRVSTSKQVQVMGPPQRMGWGRRVPRVAGGQRRRS